ncbi:methionine-S-sulfoxide reductase [Paenibacillus sp. V4I3]|nr:methionine-S-sulfoxide reductase [Paenibacillus sp. V4I3]MDQ0897445.1 methionine-S-sulfoxide reductase [Paenibacillus sp. V4I7]
MSNKVNRFTETAMASGDTKTAVFSGMSNKVHGTGDDKREYQNRRIRWRLLLERGSAVREAGRRRSVVTGYTGGHTSDPTYEKESTGNAGHLEEVQVRYDPSRISYDQLLQVFWRKTDPTDAEGQFADRGTENRSVIFYDGKEQQTAAEASKGRSPRKASFRSRS